MVTKPTLQSALSTNGFILAKNHMVTKPISENKFKASCLILAKNHMVTKQNQPLL